MRTPFRLATCSALAALATVLVSQTRAGDLNPPAGPIAPTMKPLDAVEPRIPLTQATTPGQPSGPLASTFEITAPGSYYLVGNLAGEANKHGVLIGDDVRGVTIDLMGFAVSGGENSRGGIVSRPGASDVAVFNGSVRGWTQGGVNLSNSSGARLKDLRVSDNGGVGISAGTGSVVTACMAYDNSATGISVGSRGVLRNCAARSNGSNGISAGEGSVITRCASVINDGSGFSIGFECVLTECASHANELYGVITSGFGCSITDNNIRSNNIDGIRVTENSTVRGNLCIQGGEGDAGAGVRATGPGNRIEGNHCFSNRYGVQVGAGGNAIIGNTCRENSEANWSVAPGNFCQIVVANTSGFVAGNSGGVTPGSTSRWINFTY